MLRFLENFKRSLSDFFLTAPFGFFGCFSFFHIWISLIFSLFSGFFFFLRFFSDERLFFYYVCQITLALADRIVFGRQRTHSCSLPAYCECPQQFSYRYQFFHLQFGQFYGYRNSLVFPPFIFCFSFFTCNF